MEKQTILVYLETAEDQVIKVSLEALNAARQLAAKTGKNVTAVLIGSAAAAGAAAAYGADEVVHVAADSYQADRYTEILTALYQRAEASALLLESGRDGKELAARVAARVGAGCVTDAMALAEDGSWVRSVYGGSLQESVDAGVGAVVTVRSGTFGKPEETAGRTVPVTEETVENSELKAVIKEAVQELSESVNLEDAEVIVAGGRGMGSAENFQPEPSGGSVRQNRGPQAVYCLRHFRRHAARLRYVRLRLHCGHQQGRGCADFRRGRCGHCGQCHGHPAADDRRDQGAQELRRI